MIAELRAEQLDLHARATFTKDGEIVRGTRSVIADLARPEPTQQDREVARLISSSRLTAAYNDGFVEVG